MHINDIAKDVNEQAHKSGWWESPKNIGEVNALIHSEISEALEEYRNGHAVTEIYYKDGKPEGFGIEWADCIIRILDNCKEWGIDMEECLRIKIAYNKTRAYRHGGKVC